MKYVAFIPLRGGSKSIPRKNVLPIGGKPLCQWVIEAAANTPAIEQVYVATDSDEIRDVVSSLSLAKVQAIGRGAETATDTASTESAMLEFCRERDFENIILIQATSPLLSSTDLEQGIETFERTVSDSLVSVVEQKRFTWTINEDQLATPTNYDPLHRPRRQDFSPSFVENGAFYITKRAGLLSQGSRLYGKMSAHVMPEETFHELDEPVDWTIIENFLQQRSSAPKASMQERVKEIRIVLSDIDGVMTDSGMYYSETGDELKKFNTRDGKGFELLRNAGLKVGIVTAEDTRLVAARAKKLKTDYLFQGAVNKLPALEKILKAEGLGWSNVAYIGDDLGDVPVMGKVGFSAAPRDARPEALKQAHFVCQTRGGQGCVREFAELILGLRGRS